MLFRGSMGLASTPESYIESAVCTMSVRLGEFSGLGMHLGLWPKADHLMKGIFL
jgi:hypothetical protein